LDKVSEFVELIDKVRKKNISLANATRQMDKILAKNPRFGPILVIFGYFLSCVGLTMLFRPEPRSLMIAGAAGILVGLITLLSRWRPRFDLLLPVFAAILVSTLIFNLTRLGFIYGPANLLITPLITFLPGALLTTGMIELASMHIISGSSRLIYGAAVLLLLFIGIAIGLSLSGLSVTSFPHRGSCIPLVGAAPGHFFIWNWHLHPLIRLQSRFILDAIGPLHRHDRAILW
jgi:uncharacterized membrane protein YjjP (DUF1212 family)